MKAALGLAGTAGFLYQLSPMKTKKALAIPAVNFAETPASLKKILNQPINIYVTPDVVFMRKFREIFQQTKLRYSTVAKSKRWLGGPRMQYWPQQLNFAMFCATQGCRISCEIFDRGMTLLPQIRAFFKFHVYFTVRRILYQLGGIQSISTLPGDPTFDKSNDHYHVASYKRICDEFGVDSSGNFHFTHGANHGLGSIYFCVRPPNENRKPVPRLHII